MSITNDLKLTVLQLASSSNYSISGTNVILTGLNDVVFAFPVSSATINISWNGGTSYATNPTVSTLGNHYLNGSTQEVIAIYYTSTDPSPLFPNSASMIVYTRGSNIRIRKPRVGTETSYRRYSVSGNANNFVFNNYFIGVDTYFQDVNAIHNHPLSGKITKTHFTRALKTRLQFTNIDSTDLGRIQDLYDTESFFISFVGITDNPFVSATGAISPYRWRDWYKVATIGDFEYRLTSNLLGGYDTKLYIQESV